MTHSEEYLQGYAKGLDVIADAIKYTTYSGKGIEAVQNMLNGVIEAIHYNRGVIKEERRELDKAGDSIFGTLPDEIEQALRDIGFVIKAKGGN